ncbi:MAG: GNAT family N-acetyltransferase [Bacteroidia bacterium]|nr:GNAT family N-acetyltransferase [Bacteroidia bacterium]
MLLHNKESERIIFKNITENDFEIWMEFASDPEAVKYFPPVANPSEMVRNWLDRCKMRYEKYGFGMYSLTDKNTGEYVGQCGILVQEIEGENYLEVGYHLLTKHRKKGYATEAATFCRDYAFKNNMLDLPLIGAAGKKGVISIIHPENLNSQAVAKRNGMTKERTVPWKDVPHCIFTITQKEWEFVSR